MIQPQNGRAMDQATTNAGSVRRARQRAEAGLPRENLRRPVGNSTGGAPRANRPQAPPGLQTRDGQIAMVISRPTPMPQWPLPEPTGPAELPDTEVYRPPPGRPQPPQRPPRPSQVPSILDGSRIQDHAPIFQYAPQRGSELSAPETQGTSSSRPSTLSSVGSIPDFPLPQTTPTTPARRSVNLGPPPSARRGASSFYSTASYVSPIPEESPRTRSYASSGAMPDTFGDVSPGYSNKESFYDDTIAEESISSEDAEADDSRLVRSASIGKRGKPALVVTKISERAEAARPTPKPVQKPDFKQGTAYVDGSSSSSEALDSSRGAGGATLTADSMLDAFEAASATDPSAVPKSTTSPRPLMMSAFRRPPRLDIDAVREAEARGSLTSLPDLIQRATRLASMIDKGRRPASRFDELDFGELSFGNKNRNKDQSYDTEKHQSGLSDMIAAFPPPAAGSRQSNRQSRLSWPLDRKSWRDQYGNQTPGDENRKSGRRCCGLPLWAAALLALFILCIIAAAIALPLYFLVFNNPNNNISTAQPATECQGQFECLNGGTYVISQGVCSCICSNGFTGVDCGIPSAQGCATASIVAPNSNIDNATVGQAIPRLIEAAQANFSIPLSATAVMAKFNNASLSCNTQNALVTFEGQAMPAQGSLAELTDFSLDGSLVRAATVPLTVTILPDTDVTLTIADPAITDASNLLVTTLTEPTTVDGAFSTLFATTITGAASQPSASPTSTRASPSATGPTRTTTTPQPSATFTVSQQVVDFARVAVLYVLQEEDLNGATAAQASLQRFLSMAGSRQEAASKPTVENAMNVDLGEGNQLDLVNFALDIGSGRIGGVQGD